MTIFLDMDGVLTDFNGGIASLWGLSKTELESAWPFGEYNAGVALARAMAKKERDPNWKNAMPLTKEEFWNPIHERPGFWFDLAPLPWAPKLFADARDVSQGKLWVVTSQSRCAGCIREKEDWLSKHFGLKHDRMIPTPHKELMARQDRILIDDYDRNVDAWVKEGGKGIIFPAYHNRFWTVTDPMPYVLGRMEQIVLG